VIQQMGMGDILKNAQLAPQFAGEDQCETWLAKFVTETKEMIQLKDKVRRLAPVDHSVMINGPSGTGKELLAKALHGRRHKDRFVAVNCSGIPDSLAESELFGHVKGAFTGAVKDRKGYFEQAHEGTIFLDEIAELSPFIQAKLLRVLNDGTIRRVGDDKDMDVNVRVVSATHQPIEQWVEYGRFREDLYYRLTEIGMLKTMPLKLRKKDVPLIVKALDTGGKIENITEFVSRIPLKETTEGGEKIEIYLPGNVRSIQQLMHRYVVLGLWPNEE
jgi:transcriptional regulator with PAS, ATPase and Fis domain